MSRNQYSSTTLTRGSAILTTGLDESSHFRFLQWWTHQNFQKGFLDSLNEIATSIPGGCIIVCYKYPWGLYHCLLQVSLGAVSLFTIMVIVRCRATITLHCSPYHKKIFRGNLSKGEFAKFVGGAYHKKSPLIWTAYLWNCSDTKHILLQTRDSKWKDVTLHTYSRNIQYNTINSIETVKMGPRFHNRQLLQDHEYSILAHFKIPIYLCHPWENEQYKIWPFQIWIANIEIWTWTNYGSKIIIIIARCRIQDFKGKHNTYWKYFFVIVSRNYSNELTLLYKLYPPRQRYTEN